MRGSSMMMGIRAAALRPGRGVLGRVDAGGFTVTPSLAVSRIDGVGPLGVVFDATATTVSSGDAFHDLLYFFDFGDGTSENYTYGTLAGTTKNRFVGGPVSCHVYETPGSYTATLWVYDGSKIWGPVTQSITVADPDVVYAGALTTVVSTDGDFTGAPAGAVQVTSNSFSDQGAVMTSNRRVLFKRGQEFVATVSTEKSGTRNLFIGAFGAGAKPVIHTSNPIQVILRGWAAGSNPANNPQNWRVTGLRFEVRGGAVGVFGVGLYGERPSGDITTEIANTRWTVHDCEIENCMTALICQNGGGGSVYSKVRIANGNNGNQDNGLALFLGNSYRVGTIDCYFDNNSMVGTCYRAQGGIVQCLISSTIMRPRVSRHFLTIRGSTAGWVTRYFVCSNNFLDGIGLNSAPGYLAQISPNAISANEPIEDVLFDGNLITHYSVEGRQHLVIEASKVTVRNNVFYTSPAFTGGSAVGVLIDNSNTAGLPPRDRNKIYNNTFFFEAARGYTAVSIKNQSTNTQVFGNVAYAPAATKNYDQIGNVPTFSMDGGAGTLAGLNSTDAQVKSSSPLFSGAPTSMAGFKLQTGSPYKNAGGNFKNWIDGLGFIRKVGNQFDAGAMNSVDKQTDAWTLIP